MGLQSIIKINLIPVSLMYVLNTTGEINMWTETWPTEAPNKNWDHEQRSSQGHHLALPQQRPIKDALSVYPERGPITLQQLLLASFLRWSFSAVCGFINERRKRDEWKQNEHCLAYVIIPNGPHQVAFLPRFNGSKMPFFVLLGVFFGTAAHKTIS